MRLVLLACAAVLTTACGSSGDAAGGGAGGAGGSSGSAGSAGSLDDAGSEGGATTCSLDAPSLPKGRVHGDGTALKDELGRTVILRGANTGGRSKFAPFVPFDFAGDSDFDRANDAFFTLAASFGFDVVRLTFSWEALEPTEGSYDQQYLDRYAKMVDAAWSHGIRVLVDFHQDAYASPFGGDGFPVWTLGSIPHGAPTHDKQDWFGGYTTPGSGVQLAFDQFWRDTTGLQAKWKAMWLKMASTVGDEPGVIGFEVINEPGWGVAPSGREDLEKNVLMPAVDAVGTALQQAYPDVLVFQGGPGQDAVDGTTFLPNSTLSHMVYAPHRYDPLTMIGLPWNNRTDANHAAIQTFVDWGKTNGRPVFFGEFGSPWTSTDHAAYDLDSYEQYDLHQVHATIWELSSAVDQWNGEDLRLVDATGTLRDGAEVAIRAYPRAVDGTISSFAWDATSHVFTMEVASAGSGVSEVYVPPRFVTASPKIEATGACVHWDGATGQLLVQASGASFTLRVSPP